MFTVIYESPLFGELIGHMLSNIICTESTFKLCLDGGILFAGITRTVAYVVIKYFTCGKVDPTIYSAMATGDIQNQHIIYIDPDVVIAIEIEFHIFSVDLTVLRNKEVELHIKTKPQVSQIRACSISTGCIICFVNPLVAKLIELIGVLKINFVERQEVLRI